MEANTDSVCKFEMNYLRQSLTHAQGSNRYNDVNRIAVGYEQFSLAFNGRVVILCSELGCKGSFLPPSVVALC